jgi:hypothetical protein
MLAKLGAPQPAVSKRFLRPGTLQTNSLKQRYNFLATMERRGRLRGPAFVIYSNCVTA